MFGEASRRLGRWAQRTLPERQVYLRQGEDWWVAGLSTRAQLVGGAAGALLVGWTAAATLTAAVGLLNPQSAGLRTYYERLVSERQARLDTALHQLSARNDPFGRLTADVERRHAALAMVVGRLAPETGVEAASATPAGTGSLARLQAVRIGQERLLARAEVYARSRAERLRFALRLAGVGNAAALRSGSELAIGGPLIDARDPRALAAVLDVDAPFAARIQHAAGDLAAVGALSGAVADLPLGEPVADPVRSSGFGVRSDPFTHAPAFHAGQDFSGGRMAPISATGPGVVSFTGQRTGYGATVEIDHGRGFKTRYAHLAAIIVKPGQRVALGQRIGGMGSTGRSTGVHLHYEVWVNGRVQDPNRFLKAGDYVHANG